MNTEKLKINSKISIPLDEIEFTAVRSEGPGGQHVNKSNTAIHLRFNIIESSLPQWLKEKLINLSDSRITASGEIIIKSQEQRFLTRNKKNALNRLKEIILIAAKPEKKRKKTKPSKRSIQKRLDEKKQKGKLKEKRKKVFSSDE